MNEGGEKKEKMDLNTCPKLIILICGGTYQAAPGNDMTDISSPCMRIPQLCHYL